jgi:hypothetical protein
MSYLIGKNNCSMNKGHSPLLFASLLQCRYEVSRRDDGDDFSSPSERQPLYLVRCHYRRSVFCTYSGFCSYQWKGRIATDSFVQIHIIRQDLIQEVSFREYACRDAFGRNYDAAYTLLYHGRCSVSHLCFRCDFGKISVRSILDGFIRKAFVLD